MLILPYIYARDAAGNPTLTERRARIFRNGLGLVFQYPIHEVLKFGSGVRVRERRDIAIIHNKVAPDGVEPRAQPAHPAQGGGDGRIRHSSRLWRMLAVEEAPARAIPIFRKVFADFSSAYSPGILSGLHVACARKMMAIKQFDAARDQLELAVAIYPRWREPHFYLCQALWFLKRYEEGLQALAVAEGIARPGREIGQYDPSIYSGTALLEWRFFILRSLSDTTRCAR